MLKFQSTEKEQNMKNNLSDSIKLPLQIFIKLMIYCRVEFRKIKPHINIDNVIFLLNLKRLQKLELILSYFKIPEPDG